ncbi:MAG: hypothetical protein EAZ29_06075 [Runella slithyformis]|nr:MAG: hypothetical protein EAZ38_02980 [Cytophagales bacterium]TAG53066.1 MAG: hypothetical protein EAZ29_06075 [Runella slithyformis]TAG76420.1 MAG: hypothetical protein EAZ22_18180 [Cytophagales bacterium]
MLNCLLLQIKNNIMAAAPRRSGEPPISAQLLIRFDFYFLTWNKKPRLGYKRGFLLVVLKQLLEHVGEFKILRIVSIFVATKRQEYDCTI